MTSRHSFSTSDERLEEFLDEKDNKSAFIEAAVRRRMWESEELQLTKSQQKAIDWLRMRVGNGMIELNTATNRIAQLTNKGEKLVMQDVIKPLENKGLINIVTGISSVSIEIVTKSGGKDV